MAFCNACGATFPDNLKFCTGCGKPIDAGKEISPPAAASAAPPIQAVQPIYYHVNTAAASDAPPPAGSPYAVVGTWGFIGLTLLFMIPVIGWLVCLIMAFAAKNRNRRHFARATLIFMIIGILISIALSLFFSWLWSVAAQNISEAAGAQGVEFQGLSGLLEFLMQFIKNPVPSGQ